MNLKAFAGVILGLWLFVMTTSVAIAQGYAYGVDAQKKLWYFDLSDASSTLVGDTGVTAQSLGMDSAGKLYATSSNGGLYAVNTGTAAATLVGFMGIGIVASMDWDATNGRMLVANFSSTPSVYSVDLATAVASLVKTATSSPSTLQTLATRTGSSILDVRHASGSQGTFGDKHATMDTSTGLVSTLTGIHSDVSAMDRGSDGMLYGLTKFGRLLSIDPSDGSEIDIGLVNGGIAFVGMTSAVPEPAIGVLMALGLVLLLCLRKRLG